MLMFQAGNEVGLGSKELRAGAVRGTLTLLITLMLSLPVGFAVGALFPTGRSSLLVVLVAGSSAAVAFPTIRERGLTGPAIAILITWMTLADALTAVLMPLALSAANQIPLALVGDGLIVAVAIASTMVARRLFETGLADEVKRESKHRHWALQLRLSVLLLLALAAIADRTGASLLVAGFAAGIELRRFNEPNRLAQQLTGLASGFFVPAFFVLLGASLDLSALVRSPSAIGLALAMVVGATVVHVMASFDSRYRDQAPRRIAGIRSIGTPGGRSIAGPGQWCFSAGRGRRPGGRRRPDAYPGKCRRPPAGQETSRCAHRRGGRVIDRRDRLLGEDHHDRKGDLEGCARCS